MSEEANEQERIYYLYSNFSAFVKRKKYCCYKHFPEHRYLNITGPRKGIPCFGSRALLPGFSWAKLPLSQGTGQ